MKINVEDQGELNVKLKSRQEVQGAAGQSDVPQG